MELTVRDLYYRIDLRLSYYHYYYRLLLLFIIIVTIITIEEAHGEDVRFLSPRYHIMPKWAHVP